ATAPPSLHDALPIFGGFRPVEPDGVRKIRRTQLWIALAGLAMAGRAVLGEDFGPGIRNVAAGRQRQHVLHYGVDLIAAQYVSECRHFGDPRLVVACKADAMGDRGADILWRAAPQPFIVVEVRIAGRSGRA